MFFFFGLGSGKKNLKLSVSNTCNICKESGAKGLYKTYDYFHIIFLPIIFFLVKYYIVCPKCNNGQEITKQDYYSIKKGVVPEHLKQDEQASAELLKQIETKIQQQTEKAQVFESIDQIMQIASANPVLSKNPNKLHKAIVQHLNKKFEHCAQLDDYIAQYFASNR